MPIGTIISAKELSQTYQPLLLVEITFADASVLRLSTHDFRSTTSGIQWNGHDYLPRIMNGELSATQALSSLGIDTIPQITLKLADADKTLWQNYEATAGKGFRGASIVFRFVFYDVVGQTFSTDSIVKFVGICESPSADSETMTVRAINRLNMAKCSLPSVQFQRICPWCFPDTSATGLTTAQAQKLRQSAADDRTYPAWNCGYSPDATGANARGNYSSGTTPFTTCDQSPGSCMARMGNPNTTTKNYGGIVGDITHDKSGRTTGRFGGICWPIPTSWEGIAYGQSKSTKWNPNWQNTPLYDQFIPMVYGTCMVSPVVTNVVGDPNSTRGEAIIALGPVQQIYTVNVNDHDIQPTNSLQQMTASFPVSDTLRRYRVISNGDRNGDVTADAPYNSTGDPTGGMCKIEWCVYSNEAPSSAPPTIRCIVFGNKTPAIQPFTSISSGLLTCTNNLNFGEGTEVTIIGTGTALDNTTWQTLNNSNTQFQLVGCTASCGAGYFAGAINDASQNLSPTVSGITQGDNQPLVVSGQAVNPVWALLDVLVKGGISYGDLDLASWIAAAAVCNRQVNYASSDGSTQSHALYSCSVSLDTPRSIADIIRGIRLACKATLRPSGSGVTGGLLGIQIDQTLADQQPTVIADSNYQTQVASIDHTATLSHGFVAYKFDESTILRNGTKSTLEITQQPINNSYNSCTFGFQDVNNSFVNDTVTVRSSQDINNIGQEVSYGLPVLGINSYDHAKRIGAWFIAKGLQGNPRGDASGTWTAKWQTSCRAQHLQIGDLIMLSSAQYGITNQLFRVTSITPAADWETMTIEAAWHLDTWYADAFGQAGFQLIASTEASLSRPPYPWMPGQDAPVNPSDPFGKDYTFDISQQYSSVDSDGVITPQIVINGKTANTVTSTTAVPPLFDLIAQAIPTGGTIQSGKAYSVAICTQTADGLWSVPSRVLNVGIPSGVNTYSIKVTALNWRAVKVNGTAVPLTAYGVFIGPDNNHLSLQGTYTDFPSAITITSYTPGTVGVPDPQFDHFRAKLFLGRHTGSWGGTVSGLSSTTISTAGTPWTAGALVGRVASCVALASSSGVPVKNYTITANTTNTITVTGNPVTDSVSIGDVFVIRLGVSSWTANSITESAWSGTTPMTANAEAGKTLRIVQGTGKGQCWPILSNTTTTVTINGVFSPQPDATSVWVITESGVYDFTDSPSMPITMDVPKEVGWTVLVEVDTVDVNGQECVNNLSPVRDIYIWGCQGTRTISTTDTQRATDGRVFCTSTGGSYAFQLLADGKVVNQQLLIQKISSDTNTVTVTAASGDTFSDGTTTHALTNQGDSILLQF